VLGSIASSAEAGSKMVDQAVGLAVGSHASLSSETQKLLHKRLQISTMLLFFGFFASLIAEGFFFAGLQGSAEYLRFWSEVFLTTIMGMISWRLLANCPHLFRNLRLVEFVVFGSAAWILALNSWVLLEQGAAAKHSVSLSGPWQALVFTYALFIPNHWRRALSGIAAMSFAPVMITIASSLFSPNVARLAVESMDFTHGVVTLCLMSAFATVTATWGVYTIGSLRSEVFSAKQFGQYRLSRLLGSGGMGEVYVGEHLLLKRPCAIKVIKPQQASDPRMLERFEREVRSTAKLTHWNTVAIYDYGRADDGTFFYVMEYLPGLNLSQIVKMFGPMPAGRVVHLLVQICDALAEAHHHGMVHRDLKPANIFASKRGSKYDVAKLLDFGLVRRIVRRDGQVDAAGAAVGSPLYMSPEQATGRAMDHRSDLYSLGVTAFYLLTGRPPFNDAEPMRVLRAHAKQTPPTFASLNVPVPEDLAAVIKTCLQKQPEDRFENVEQMRQALLGCKCAAEWSWHHAAQWWKLHRCPEKSRLDHAIESDRLAEWLAETEVSRDTVPEPVPALADRAMATF
jgi:serine/threonine-protein kinase